MSYPRNFKTKRRQPAYRLIAEALREQIRSGELLPGAQFPTTRDLSIMFRTSYFTIHTAMIILEKEGWVERIHGSGTYVGQPKKRISSVGIYYGSNVFFDEESAFYRGVHYALQERLASLKKTTKIFVDSRPKNQQAEVLPALMQAVNNKEIQCVIAPLVNVTDFPALSRLPLPTAFVVPKLCPNSVTFDNTNFFQETLRCLKAQGCRSVGLITNVYYEESESTDPNFYFDTFFKELKAVGMVTRNEWVRKPGRVVHEIASYGYSEFRNLWALPHKPDALIIHPDSVVRGAITAILESGTHARQQMKFVFHRNAHVNLLCPFPAIWAISDEQSVAEGLIELVEKQFKGEETSMIVLPYKFQAASTTPEGLGLSATALQPEILPVDIIGQDPTDHGRGSTDPRSSLLCQV